MTSSRKVALAELATITGSELVGDPSYEVTGVAYLDTATPQDVSFLVNPRYEARHYEALLQQSQAGVICVDTTLKRDEKHNYLISDNPFSAFQKIAKIFHGDKKGLVSGFKGIHPTAVIHDSVKVGKNVTIGPYAVIDQDAVIGDDTFIGALTSIGVNVVIGNECIIYPKVAIREDCVIGHRVILQPGVVIGSCGFGMITDDKGHHTRLDQLGNVVLEDDVEIGANTTIDKARLGTTRISRGTKIDNLVQIAHNVVVGEDNIIVSQSGIAGSTKTGQRVVLAAQVGVNGHIELSDDVIISASSKIHNSIKKPGTYGGIPVVPIKDFRRNIVTTTKIHHHISSLRQRITALEKQLQTGL